MTPETLELARRNQAEADVTNAEFLEGTMEDIPLDESQDLADFAAGLRPEDVPANLDAGAVIEAMEGAVASAFVRATKPV